MRFSFVILHYNSLEETVKCVDSIKCTQKGKDFKIVIVDNNSPDGSGSKLEQLFGEDELIVVLRNKQNLGFARGNNVGFNYAKYELKSDFIILQNSDTMVLQDDFQKLVTEEYASSGFAVLGPFIKTPHPPFNSNPGPTSIPGISFFKNKLLKYRLHLLFTYLHIDWFFIRLHQRKISSSMDKDDGKTRKRAYNVRLHGSFMVFSPRYIELFDGLNEKTFLFEEENLLFLRLRQNGLTSVYLPQVEIFHEEDASTNNSFKAENKKNRFIYKCKIQSAKIVINELLQNSK